MNKYILSEKFFIDLEENNIGKKDFSNRIYNVTKVCNSRDWVKIRRVGVGEKRAQKIKEILIKAGFNEKLIQFEQK